MFRWREAEHSGLSDEAGGGHMQAQGWRCGSCRGPKAYQICGLRRNDCIVIS